MCQYVHYKVPSDIRPGLVIEVGVLGLFPLPLPLLLPPRLPELPTGLLSDTRESTLADVLTEEEIEDKVYIW